MSLCFADISQSMPIVANESDSCNENSNKACKKKDMPCGFSKKQLNAHQTQLKAETVTFQTLKVGVSRYNCLEKGKNSVAWCLLTYFWLS